MSRDKIVSRTTTTTLVQGTSSPLSKASGSNFGIVSQLRDLSRRLLDIIEERKKLVPPPFTTLQEPFTSTIEELHNGLDVIDSYDWAFDQYLEDDLPAVINFVRGHSGPRDGKLHAAGHSMGDPAQALKVPVVPIGGLLATAFPLAARPPCIMSWLSPKTPAHDMMDSDLLEKLVLNNFCVNMGKSVKIAFRVGQAPFQPNFCFKTKTLSFHQKPFMMAKLIPQHLLKYKVFGEPGGPHYAHYDIVEGRLE